ncbi:putative MPP superfamily phosphohydrolase [Litorivivens lipolytica]|uniref:Putative MPP superfamily phosphohydrolase n=1 Tax=Litorivivens lipolytica TaxID=1524264 RepID=A0A7W4W4K4_9GAMM|nr:metallophosphoesterase [Litorivivens lipolytica]MBB3046784.1 putative MPP superfamily phosphohydrolase [Litorivivens lipolytica]
MPSIRTWCLYSVIVLISACNGGGGGSDDAPPSPASMEDIPETTLEPELPADQEDLSRVYSVVANQQVTLNFADGATLKIPRTALSQNQTLTLDIIDSESGRSYRILPEGLPFRSPAQLTLPVSGKKTVIAQRENGTLTPLLSSVLEQTQAVASLIESGDYLLVERPVAQVSRQIGPACNPDATEQELRFVHVADLHARYGSPDKLFSRIKAYHNRAVQEQPYTLFTNGGDDFEKGSVAELRSEGTASVAVTKAMKFDVRVVGNHEFAWGADTLIDYANDDHAQVIASNSHHHDREGETPFNANAFSVIQVGCLKVGFFGMSSPPWNELDEPIYQSPIPDFVPEIRMNWHWEQIARGVVDQYSDQVDMLVMLSHLGVGSDEDLLRSFPEIDIALGGHTHGGTDFTQLSSGNIVLQPDFFAQGLSDLKLTYSLTDRSLSSATVEHVDVFELRDTDAEVEQFIADIMTEYAGEAYTEIALADAPLSKTELAQLAAKAALFHHGADAALLDPEQVVKPWVQGSVNQTHFVRAYPVERQPSDTPGFKAFYRISVSQADFAAMQAAQPTWVVETRDGALPDPLTLIVQKGPAWNIPLFFNNLAQPEYTFLSEVWESLDQYARHRTTNCLYLDSDRTLSSCTPDTVTTTWQFNNALQPFLADSGPSGLGYYRGSSSASPENETRFESASNLGVPLPEGVDSGIMAFPDYSPREGLKLTPNVPTNGSFNGIDKLAEYSVVMDIYWPKAAEQTYRAFLQTSVDNSDDADGFFEGVENGGVGISTSRSGYFGDAFTDTWHRVGIVFYTHEEHGLFKVYIDGKLVGSKRPGQIGERWAISDALLLLTDNNYETEDGYLNALLFSGRALTDNEMEQLGATQQELRLQLPTEVLQRRVRQHQSQPTF